LHRDGERRGGGPPLQTVAADRRPIVDWRSAGPTMDAFTELRQPADDLAELGDTATAALVRQAIDRLSAWKFEAGERLLERAPEERCKHEPPGSPYFNTCVLAVA